MSRTKTNLVVADTETGGLDPGRNPILTLSAICTESGKSFNAQIKPVEGMHIEEGALRVTGLDPEILRKEGQDEREVALGFSKFISEAGEHVVSGCNFPFDQRFIAAMYRRQKLPNPISHRCVDLQTAAFLAHELGVIELPVNRGVPLVNLDAVSKVFGVSRESELHDSLEDVKLTHRCLDAAIEALRKDKRVAEPKNTNFVIVDTTTSGLVPGKHTILSIGAMRTSDGARFHRWVVPEKGSYGDKKAMEINGLDVETLRKEGVSLERATKDFMKFLYDTGSHVLAGCNVAFDVDFIEDACRKYGIRPPFGGKRLDLQTAAYIAHECGGISLPSKNGVPDISFDGIAQSCGLARKKNGVGSSEDVEVAALCLARCTGISVGKDRKTLPSPFSGGGKAEEVQQMGMAL